MKAVLERRWVLAALACVAALVLVGGGWALASGGSDSAQVASLDEAADDQSTDDGSGGAVSSDPQDLILEYTACLRDQGFDVPDPDFSGGFGPGGGGAGGLEEAGIDPDDPAFQAAQEECQGVLAGIQQQFDESFGTEIQDAALEYAQCMRNNGIDVEDPDFGGGFGGPGAGGPGAGGGPFGDLDLDDPAVQAADEECRAVFEGLGLPFGGGNP